MSRRARLGTLLAVPLLCCCGVPTGGPPETIPATAVPFDLGSPVPSGTVATPPPSAVGGPRVYLVDEDDVLVARGRTAPPGPLLERVGGLLADLAAGPTRAERDDQVSTTLPPEVQLTVAGVSDGTVTVDVAGVPDASTIRESRRAVAQIVLTATSLPEVDGVLLTRDGTPVEAPLASGQLTSRPLTGADYAGFLTAPPP